MMFIVIYQIHFSISIKVITKLPNSEQSYKGKVQTHNYINRQNQSTTGKLDDDISKNQRFNKSVFMFLSCVIYLGAYDIRHFENTEREREDVFTRVPVGKFTLSNLS